jgi:hypothetical protein
MTMKNLALAATIVLTSSSFARGQSAVVCTPITSLPYTITAQGNYCLDRNLSINIATGAAITIATDFVTLDLNSFKIGGGAAGPSSQAAGIYAKNRSNLLIRNGNIRGFALGIFLEDDSAGQTNAKGNIVEDMRLEGNLYNGAQLLGTGSVVRRNTVVNTFGNSIPNSYTNGLAVLGPGSQVIDNSVTETLATGTGLGTGIVISGDGSLVERNRVTNRTVAGNTVGIRVSNAPDTLVVDNRVSRVNTGIRAIEGNAGAFCRDNIVVGATTPYLLCTSLGNNQP